MSKDLFMVVKNFLNCEIDVIAFVDTFTSEWKCERDIGTTLTDSAQLSEALSTIFCLVDLFNPDDDRESYEFDETTLRREVSNVLQRLSPLDI